MKLTFLLLFACIALVLASCKKDPDALKIINSESFPEQKVQIQFSLPRLSNPDSIGSSGAVVSELDDMITMTKQIRQSGSDQQWTELLQRWNEFNSNYCSKSHLFFMGNVSLADTVKKKLSDVAAERWASLNIELLKLSGKVRFGDALECLLYEDSGYAFSDSLLKSIIFTHVFDDIYINIIGTSSLEYNHTTGGMVRITQQTKYPEDTGMTLSFESDDVRFLNIYIRIPGWAENPTVSYGNVKYVAQPGEYCQISKKWRTGDEIKVELKN